MPEGEQQEEAGCSAPAVAGGDETGPTFPLDVSGPGGERLRSTVKTKLSEFMGSYTDDVLAEYVVVLVGHGKHQKQAIADLEAFLGHQSEAFVAWLWDHLANHLGDYAHDGAGTGLSEAAKADEENKATTQQDATPEKDATAPDTSSKPAAEENMNAKSQSRTDEGKPGRTTIKLSKRPRSPEPWAGRRRLRGENKEEPSAPPKEPAVPEKPPPPRLRATRLLEFAMRDAVDAVRRANLKKSTDAVSKRERERERQRERERERVRNAEERELARERKVDTPHQRNEDQYRRTAEVDGGSRRKEIASHQRKFAPGQKVRQVAADKPIPNEEPKDVKEMRKRMRECELEVTRLRSSQKSAAASQLLGFSASHAPSSTVAASAHSGAPTTSVPAPPALSTKPSVAPSSVEDTVILVTNVHFATTKEALSAHFASCGDVVRVTLLADAAGKPKGSAYVEFSSRDGADRALLLNESCLLSRPLRVVRKDSVAALESGAAAAGAVPAIRAPAPVVRPLRMPIVRPPYARGGYMRGAPYMMRPPRLIRPPFAAAPHLQWKREAGAAAVNGAAAAAAMKNGFRAGVGPIRKRSLSYVRPSVPPAAVMPPSTEEQQKGGAGS